ncbi:MAG: sigma-54-dependent Fis family transcriptional regulator [Bryobacterales bacterium]|nr:sigma-54-dependent Fis family transcriptional regulator [Bryobacterales bacterium]
MYQAKEGTPWMVGESARTRHVSRQIDRVAQGRWPVLVLGETGTGKEVVARRIYGQNPEGPFVTIDCSSLVGPLLESELFGHSRGAFTGAVAQKVGLLELANGGTAFFDEVGELPLDLQAKLLRVLQEKEFRPVGAVGVKRSDFRIIAATNRDLAREVERGTFRRDLFYRLNVVTLRLSPLRERPEDIPLLVNHFLERYGRGQYMSDEAMQWLSDYEWPGTVRELENCVQQMLAMSSGPLLTPFEMPSMLQHFMQHRHEQEAPPLAAAMAAAGGSHGSFLGSFSTTTTPTPESPAPERRLPHREHNIVPLFEVEKQAILQALDYTKGDRSVAATLLGIGRTTLYRKLKEYQLAV